MPLARRPVPRPRRSRSAAPAAATAVAAVALAVPAMPATAGGASCGTGRFTATSQADLARIAVLDPGPLAAGLPALADVRLGPAHGAVDTRNRSGKTAATAGYADARLLGMHLPGLPLRDAVADHRAPGRGPGPVQVTLAALNAGGLATARLGKASAEATWTDGYHCGRTGALTRAATMIQGLSVLGGAGTTPAIQAVSKHGHTGRRTSLLKVGPTGSTQSATDLVKLRGGRIGVRSCAGVALGNLTLFAGTPQEITAKVISQPRLEAVAGGDRQHSAVTYRPAVLSVTSGGKPVTGLDGEHDSVSVDLLGRMAADRPAAPLTVRLSLGSPSQEIGDSQVRAQAAALRVEVKLGSAHVLDVALGHLSVSATAPARSGGRTPGGYAAAPADADHPGGSGADEPGGSSADQPGSPVGSSADQPGSPADQPGSSADQPGSPADWPADRPGAPAGSAGDQPDGSPAGQGADSPAGQSGDSPGGAGGRPAPGTASRHTGPGRPGAAQDGASRSPAGVTPASGTPKAAGLALTGTNVAAVGLGGVALVSVGLATLFLTRRRRGTGR
ncbi:hypothetical protein [Actinoplanes teichomyceticus]|uniref:LPXTG-motif cell wall-anchored protein n=1 Tax=Actinoplanes teichomyceticus TaxID=1867 RepID=A0A561WJQ1_ACTTI|nr:hypothetical protein [Actinoplanes teichomyceticus]TWG24092.1 hypothetical protein FHX34_102645 [Actinoplanes teichomyceticus]GIF12133.1 hypothetical protein Ate01nite_21650 [Actinoplanes teichomyceticus]